MMYDKVKIKVLLCSQLLPDTSGNPTEHKESSIIKHKRVVHNIKKIPHNFL